MKMPDEYVRFDQRPDEVPMTTSDGNLDNGGLVPIQELLPESPPPEYRNFIKTTLYGEIVEFP